MGFLERLVTWQQTKKGLLTFGLLEFAAAGLFLYWALTGGFWLDWVCFVILVSGFTQNFVRLIGKVKNREQL